ncbi:unnamed protein product [Paramecium primaurelia]|uniref:Uncharacterized protein n=1 Tax=Paramecium primaurelia TaxID=5886 RepID=A0A8S1JUE0_PARPR|nr:unnamed protein product [Paramecium primaurelia]
MNYFSQQQFQGTQRKFIRLFVSSEQKKFIATVNAFEQNLSEQIANSYACTCEQFQSEVCSNKYFVTNIRQNGFSVIIPKELNIGQVLNDQTYITCKIISKAKNKNKKTNNCKRNDKQTKKTLKEQQKIEPQLPDISPPKILTSKNIPLQENKDEKIQRNSKKKNKKNKRKNQYLQSLQIIDGKQNNQIGQNLYNDQLQSISQTKQQFQSQNLNTQVQQTENIKLQELIDNVYCDALISQNINKQAQNDKTDYKKQENQYQNTYIHETIQNLMKNDQNLIQEQNNQEKSSVNNQQNNLQITNKVVKFTESNLILKETLDYFQDSLNNSQEMPKVPNSSFQTNIEHSTRQNKQKQNQNNLKQQQNDKLSQNNRQNYIFNQSNYNIHKNNRRQNKKKGKNDI